MAEFTIGREKEQSEIIDHIKNERDCIVLAPSGSGKTHLLKKIAKKFHRKTIYIEYCNSVTEAQLTIIRHLDPNLREQAKAQNIPIDRVKVPRRTSKEQRDWIDDLLNGPKKTETRGRKRTRAKEKVCIIFDHFEKVTATMRPLFDLLQDRVVFVFSGTELKNNEKYIGRVWWGLSKVYLQNLTDQESAEFLWRIVDRHKIKNSIQVEKHVLKIAQGRPLALEQIAKKVDSGVPLYDVQEQDYEGTRKQFSITLFVICVALVGVYSVTRNTGVGMASFAVGAFALRQAYQQMKNDSNTEEAEDYYG